MLQRDCVCRLNCVATKYEMCSTWFLSLPRYENHNWPVDENSCPPLFYTVVALKNIPPPNLLRKKKRVKKTLSKISSDV